MTISATNRLLAILLMVAFFTALSIAIDPFLLYIALTLLAIVIFSRFYVEFTLHIFPHLVVEVSKTIRNDRTPIEIIYAIYNPIIIPIAITEYSLYYSPLLKLISGSRTGVVIIPPRSSIKLRFVFSGRVGTYRIGPLYTVSRDIFGFFKSSAIEISKSFKIAIPPVIETAIVRRLWIYTRMVGIARSKAPGEGIEFYDVREYIPGDELRKIVWKFLASQSRLVVKEAEREYYQHILFVLDSSRGMWFGPPGQTPVEHCARIIATIANYLARRGYLLSIAIFNENGLIFSSRALAGAIGLRRVYEMLSSISYVEEEVQIQQLYDILRSIASKLPRERTLILIFTRVVDKDRMQTLIKWLKVFETMGHIPYIITPIIVSYEAVDLQPLVQKLYYIKLYSMLKQDLDIINTIKKYGVRVIATRPNDIPQKIVEIIELLHR